VFIVSREAQKNKEATSLNPMFGSFKADLKGAAHK